MTKINPQTPPVAEFPTTPRDNGYLPVSDAEAFLIERARDDPFTFIAYVSGKIPAPHHIAWLKRIFDWSDPINLRLEFIAPRDSAKSTIAVYAMVWFISRYPWKTNGIMSVTKDQAEKRMNMIKGIIEHNQRYRNVFPWIKIDYKERCTQSEFTVVADKLYDPETHETTNIAYHTWRSMIARFGSLKDPTLRTGGRGSSTIIGGRISGFMMLDDIIDEDDVNPDIQSEVYEYLMNTIIPLLNDTAKCIYIGTRWMIDDVPEKLMNNPSWYHEVISALHVDAVTGELTSYWDDYWSVPKLLARKKEMDNDAWFDLQYQNNPRALVAAKFKLDSLERPLPPVLPLFKSLYIGSDFASSLKKRADWTVFSAVAFDMLSNIYVLDMLRLKGTPDDWLFALGRFYDRVINHYGLLTKMLIERVNFQTWAESMIKRKYPKLPLDLVAPIGDKGDRLQPLAIMFNEGRGFVNKRMAEYPVFKTEALNFPHTHDDTLDSVTIVTAYVNPTISSTANVKIIKSPYLR